MVQGWVFQDSWSLLFFALVGMGVAVRFNWLNNRLGYWINLATVSVTDIGFIAFVLIPSYLPIFPGLLGPVFWLLGVVFSTIGFYSSNKNETN